MNHGEKRGKEGVLIRKPIKGNRCGATTRPAPERKRIVESGDD